MRLTTFFLGLFALSHVECIELSVAPSLSILQSNNRPNGWNQQLKTSGNEGSVSFECSGLPRQISQYRNTLFLKQRMPDGRYPIQIKATDQKGNSDKRDVIIVVGSGQILNLPATQDLTVSSSTSAALNLSNQNSQLWKATTLSSSSFSETSNSVNRSSIQQSNKKFQEDQNRLKYLLNQLKLNQIPDSATKTQFQQDNIKKVSTTNQLAVNSSTSTIFSTGSITSSNTQFPSINIKQQASQQNTKDINSILQNAVSADPNKNANTNRNSVNVDLIASTQFPVQATQNSNLIRTNSDSSNPTSKNINDLFNTYGGASTQTIASVFSAASPTSLPAVQVPVITSTTINERRPSLTVNTRISQITDKVVTRNDVARQAIIERSVTASKSIANLISIVQQSRANLNQFDKEIQSYKKQYNNALSKQREAQATVARAQSDVKKINSSIQGAQKTIAQLKLKITSLESQKVTMSRNVQIVKSEVTAAQNNVVIFSNEVVKMGKQKEKLQKELKNREVQLNQLELKILECQRIIKGENQILANIVGTKRQAKDKIVQAQKKVSDLQEKLALAKQDLRAANGQLERIQNLEKKAPNVIIQERKALDGASEKKRIRINQIDVIKKQIQNIDKNAIPGLSNQSNKLKSLIVEKSNQINNTANSLTLTVSPSLENVKKQLDTAVADLKFMKNQISLFQNNFKKVYNDLNDVNTLVVDSKDNLQAIIKRYNQEYLNLQQANVNLEKARTEKEIADLAVDQLLASRTDALPYAIVPLGDQFTNQAATLGGYGSSQGLKVTDWTHYLSQSFGNAVSQSFIDPVNNLYPFLERSVILGAKSMTNEQILKSKGVNTLSLPDSKNGAGFPCGNNAQINVLMSNCGNIKEIYQNGFKVIDNKGADQIIRVSSCTQAMSNLPNYIPKNNDKMIWKGYYDKSANEWRVSELMCITSQNQKLLQ